ncbi:hypothetical protein [Mangrovibrevibacter kandeliae]|uniref:hypothetical protein n=1 Tax=Mangrovibrevibacter kandeliae TaxID=2968473 RepID=UPI0021172F13|nr:hypothetical protein [Aurantimonas sp. CSK15Z-1]MCQ8784101.1 hypothetical protein [Aurantimonas sp. CSK15Z-1]
MRWSSLSFAVLASGLLTGCSDYMSERDSIALSAGDAPAANLAIHTTNAFPPYRDATTIRTDGKVAARVYSGYTAGSGSAAPAAAAAASAPDQ